MTCKKRLSKIKAVIALQKPERPATGGGPAGAPLFTLRRDGMKKIFLTYDQQIDKLIKEKNLRIDDIAYAKEVLRQTSYYSLIGGYKDILIMLKRNMGMFHYGY